MSETTIRKAYVFHTDLGTVVTTLKTVQNYDVEDVIRDRAIAQARAVQFLNQGKKYSPNDMKGARTLSSVHSRSAEELQD
jgi:hypothetical protein